VLRIQLIFVTLNFIAPAILRFVHSEQEKISWGGGVEVGGSGAVQSVDSTVGQRAGIGDSRHAYQLVIRHNMRMRIYGLHRRDFSPGGRLHINL
jgi:hypothetical protein